jgi:putative ABC transport system permease protein
LALGHVFAGLLVAAMNSEMFRIPLIIAPRTYAFAAVVIVVATAVSAMVVRHRLDHLDLVEVLKTRE